MISDMLKAMSMTVEVISIGDSEGILLPEEIMERLNLSVGDDLIVTETPDGLNLKVANR